MEYESHPAAGLFPMMTDAELGALGEDMLQHGQRDPIILFRGQILDGRNRYRACILKGIEPRFREERPADPFAFVASANLHRRHLDESQRAMIAAKLATMREGRPSETASWEAVSQSKAANLLQVSRPSVQRARFVQDHGVSALVTAVEEGTVKVKPAAEFAATVPPLIQVKLIAEHGSPAAAVQATAVLAKANRAANKIMTADDLRPAADRAARAGVSPDAVKAAADRAALEMPRKVPDPKPAADRAEARAGLDAARETYVATVEAAKPHDVATGQRDQESGHAALHGRATGFPAPDRVVQRWQGELMTGNNFHPEIVACDAPRADGPAQESTPPTDLPGQGAKGMTTARRMLDINQVLALVPVGRTTLFRMERDGRFPPSHWPSPGRRCWFEEEVAAWQEALPTNVKIGRKQRSQNT